MHARRASSPPRAPAVTGCAADAPACASFARTYALASAPVMLEIERSVLGSDYGATSWTTRAEAEALGRSLALAPGTRLLDVGAGAGWPSLYLAGASGCDVTLLDLPMVALRSAAARARADRLEARCHPLAGDAAAAPFHDGAFDAIVHTDVLCCLAPKRAVLDACRRVAHQGARMVFSVIAPAPDLSPAAHARAIAAGPPFVDTPEAYPALLRRSRWRVEERRDLSAQYLASTRAMVREWEHRAEALVALHGAEEYADFLARRARAIEGVERGWLRRELYAATAA